MPSFIELLNSRDYTHYRINRNYKFIALFSLSSILSIIGSYFLVSLHGAVWFNLLITLATIIVHFFLFFSVLTVLVCGRDIIRYKRKLKRLTNKVEEDIRQSSILEQQE